MGSAAGGGVVVGSGVVVCRGVALQLVTTASAVPTQSPVHNLERTGATLSCPPMPATHTPDPLSAT